jgi:hypothetical protein
MRASTKAAFGLNVQRWKWSVNADAQRTVCRSLFRDTLRIQPALRAPLRAALQLAVPAERAARLTAVADSLAGRHCNTGSFLQQADRRTLLKQADFGRIYLFGAAAEFGRQTFRYADTTNASFTSQTESPSAIVIGGGVYFPTTGVLATGTVRTERSFFGGTPRQFCVRTGAVPSLQCRSVALAGPGKGEPVLATAELRWFATSSVGVSPRMTVDLRGDLGTGIELPILLRQAGDNGFSSALALGWRSKLTDPSTDDRAYISLIVGVNFGIGLSLLR